MRTRILTAVVSILAVAGVAAVTTSTADSASSSDAVAYRTLQSGMLVGFYDDAQVYGRTDWAFKQLRGARRHRPDHDRLVDRRQATAAKPADPADKAYNWTAVDNVISKAAANKVRVLATIYGTPRWAGRARNRLRTA